VSCQSKPRINAVFESDSDTKWIRMDSRLYLNTFDVDPRSGDPDASPSVRGYGCILYRPVSTWFANISDHIGNAQLTMLKQVSESVSG